MSNKRRCSHSLLLFVLSGVRALFTHTHIHTRIIQCVLLLDNVVVQQFSSVLSPPSSPLFMFHIVVGEQRNGIEGWN